MADYGFIARPQEQNTFQKLGEMVNFARGATELQKARETMAADIAQRKAESARSQTEARVSRETADPRIAQQVEAERQARIKTNLEKFKLTGEYAQAGRNINQQFVNDPDFINGNVPGMLKKAQLGKRMMIDSGVPEDVAEVQSAHLISAIAADPTAVKQLLLNSIQAGLGSQGQAANIQERGVPVTTGQETAVIGTNPFASTPVGQPIAGTQQQQQLPPGTPVFDPSTNAPGYLGPRPGTLRTTTADLNLRGVSASQAAELARRDPTFRQALSEVQSGGTKPVQSGPALGQATTEEGKAQTVRDHFAQATANVASSALLEGIAQNIKTYGAQAIVGTEQEKLAFVNGLLEKLNISGASDLKTATDLMEKNMAQLAKNSPAATDAARVVNQLASPHPTMNAKAIAEAADQIIGQVRMSRDIYKTFLPHMLRGDNAEYLKKLQAFGDVGDARVWQFEALDPAGRASMVASMKPEDRKAFREKIEKAEKMGFFK